MKTLRLVGAVLACGLLCGCPSESAPSQGPSPGPTDPVAGSGPKVSHAPSTGHGATSPEDCFLRVKAAHEAKDWNAYNDLLTPESRASMLRSLVSLGGLQSGADEALAKEFQALLARHGIEKQAPPTPGGGEGADSEDPFKDVADRKQLFVELMAFGMERAVGQGQLETILRIEAIQVDGDRAVGQIVSRTPEGKEVSEPGRFRQVDGRWFADLETESGR